MSCVTATGGWNGWTSWPTSKAGGSGSMGRVRCRVVAWRSRRSAAPSIRTASYVLRRAALQSVDLGTFLGRPDLAGPVTLSVTGEARIRGTARSAHARMTVDSSRLGRVKVTGGEADFRLDGERLAYDASVRSTGGTVTLTGDGTAGEDPSYRVREGRLAAVDLGQLLGRSDLRTDLNTTFTAEVAGRGPDSLRAAVNVALLPSRVNQAEVTSGALEARMIAGQLEARAQAEGPDAALDATVSGTPQAERSKLSTSGTLRLEHLAKWTGRSDADGRVESRFALAVESDSTGLRTVGGTVDAIGGVGEVRVPALHVALRPADGALELDTVLVRSNVAVIDGGGRLQLRPVGQPGRLALRATLGDLAPVAALMGGDTVGVDSARAQLDVTGPAWHWKLQAAADAYGIAFGGNLANRVTLTGAVTLDSTRVGAVSGDLRVKDAAYGKLSLRELTMVGGYDSTLALDLNLNVSDSVRVATRIRGTVSSARDTVRAELQRLTLDEGGRQWALERPATLGFGPRVEVGGLALRAGQRRVAMNGVFDRHGSSDLTLTITALDLEALRAAGIVPIGGRVDGNLHLTGPAATPRLQGKMGLAILSSRGQQVGTVGSDLDWTERGLRIAAAVTPTRGSALTVEGTLPYRLTFTPRDTSAAVGSEPLASDAVSLAVRADSFDLSLLQPLLPPDAATGLGGRLRADARIGGTMRDGAGHRHPRAQARRARAADHPRRLSAGRARRPPGRRRAPDRAPSAVDRQEGAGAHGHRHRAAASAERAGAGSRRDAAALPSRQLGSAQDRRLGPDPAQRHPAQARAPRASSRWTGPTSSSAPARRRLGWRRWS